MNIRFLETFVWLAKLRSFRLTAEKLHTTQASVSNRIASLEQDFGVKMFNRTSLGVSLTPEGTRALAYAERILKLSQQMERDVADNAVVKGTIRIGVIETIVHSLLPAFLARIHQLYPKILIELTSDTSIHLSEQLVKGNLDVSFQSIPAMAEDIQNAELCSFPMRWVASPLLGIGEEGLEVLDLCRYPIISFPRNSVPHDTLSRLLADVDAEDVHLNSIASVAAMIRLTIDGFGISVLPPAVITQELAERKLQLLEVDKPFPHLTLYATYRAAPAHPIAASAVSLARQVAREFSDEHGPAIAQAPDQVVAPPL
jgi:DNA-binding transcriptional LysR family regulator